METKVTRADREAALAAWNGPNPPRVVLAVNAVIKPWIETGRIITESLPMENLTRALERIASAIRAAYERGLEEQKP